MKQLIFLPFECNVIVPNRFFVTLENAEIAAQQGDDVTLVYCDGTTINQCWINTVCDKKLCKICNRYRKQFFPFLSKNIKTVPYSSFFEGKWEDYKNLTFTYQTVQDIKQIKHKEVGIGYAAFSSYITPTRNLYPLINQNFRNYFDELLRAGVIISDIVEIAFKKFKPDQVGIFNSRFIVSRPIFDLCQTHGLDVMVYETSGNIVNNRRLTYFENHETQNVDHITLLIEKIWSSQFLPKEVKIDQAKKFFENRRNAIQAGDKVYVSEQKQGLLPDNWDNTKHNIVIFNSSEDENASLGEEFEQNLFETQYEALRFIFEKYKDLQDTHFYLRVHPNLKDVNYAYHLKLYDFEKISDNITIIPANSPISTYGMLDAADKIIVFGSTTGLEAVYWGKPVILLARCIYSLLDITHNPISTEEMDQMIKDKNLPKKPAENAIKAAYYLINEENRPFSFFSYEIKHYQILSKSFDLYQWVSKKSFIRKKTALVLQFFGKYYRDKIIKRPLKEDPNALV